MTKIDRFYGEDLLITLKCFFGFETTLAEELQELGYQETEILNRAVRVKGSWRDVYFLNLYARCAISVLVEIDRFYIQEEKDLLKCLQRIDWTEIIGSNQTFAIRGAVHSQIFKNTHYPFLLAKDAIVDVFTAKNKPRPNVDTKQPNLLFDLYISEKQATISFNTSGAPLFQRGYRSEVGEAPLNEVVAAGLVRMSGWDRKTPLLDPFCGSGTLLIEAALLATGVPSNIERQHYAFKRLKNFSSTLWEEIYENAPRIVRQLPVRIFGSDISDEMVIKTRRNLRSFSFGRLIEISSKSFEEVERPEGEVFILTNPPYDERLKIDVTELYGNLGSWLKHNMSPCQAWIISGSEEGMKSIGLKPSKKMSLFNGDIPCEFRGFEMFKGERKVKMEN
ncbi:MAG: hypothetical protein RL264_596 [Bacteroidota bacterium]|jgi:putative N6-adenine-specific DNA methylase